ncbi:variant erythrocyte surface antigen-1 family protein [Babesia caballi]|uniref:Variant erythrocyte surface antigen-1 family protein n=1 Tax=Babesia caballi TaxID=5871 RepID=A0AAV4LYA1_BABCB|nr:variant erythrocyte surface antigen-1 family protein [Babesia caballi]
MSTGKQLTDCPSNLKEAIDWILRVTEKDKQGGTSNAGKLATAVHELLRTAGVSNPPIRITQPLIENLAEGLAKFIGYGENGQAGQIGTGGIAVSGQPVNPSATGTGYKLTYDPNMAYWEKNFIGDPPDAAKRITCAKIFMGCVPMIFSALNYLYWRCDQPVNQGGWMGSGLKSAGPLKNFMVGMGYKPSELNERMKGSEIFESIEQEKLKDFFDAMTKAKSASVERFQKEEKKKRIIYPSYISPVSASSPTYLEFLEEMRKTARENLDNHETSPLSTLYYCAACYFQCLHTNNATRFTKTPQSIREMLYFLAALPFSPSYDALNEHISTLFQNLASQPTKLTDAENMIPVADSGIQSPHNTLSADQIKEYLTKSCSLSLTVLGIIQGHGASENTGEPWLHELFCNSAFHLMYPSGPTLFNALSRYSYALQFQLYFLYAQCYSTFSQGRGWRGCRYGREINKGANTQVNSHICAGFKCKNPPQCKHRTGNNNSSQCFHNEQNKGCGYSLTDQSPLQAFLTDNLKGFSLGPSSTSDHLNNHPPAYMCHVRMGFHPKHLRQNAGTGNYLYSALGPFCSNSNTPLRQLSEKLGCLTKRTPQTLGDLFGFVWHLNGQLFKYRPTLRTLMSKFLKDFGVQNQIPNITSNRYLSITELWNRISERNSTPQSPQNHMSSVISRSIASMAPAIPFLYQLFMTEDPNTLPGAIFDLTQHCHGYEASDGGTIKIVHKSPGFPAIDGHTCSEPSDLWSLYYPISQASAVGAKDTHSACRNKNCGGYLEPLTLTHGATFSPSTAAAYLSWMAYLTDDMYGWLSEMRDDFNNISCEHCNRQCQQGTPCHADSACSCPSVVQCAGVLPLLYRHGFQFHDAFSLKDTSTIRSCQKFQTALSNVLSANAPLAKLLESIDDFLYMFRFYFFYNLSSFWLCSLTILLYFIFYGIDVLHFKSHVHFPSSHSIPPVALLTTGTAPALTKLNYYMP